MTIRTLALACSFLFFINACSESEAPESSASQETKETSPSSMKSEPTITEKPGLVKSWELDGFMAPESALFDEATDIVYVSNVNGAPNEKDGNGFISKVSTEGEMLELKWVEGMDAPKGLAMVGRKLYIADIDTLIEVDVETGTITNTFVAAGAQFLNDVAAATDGTVFVSDMVTNKIHALENGIFSVWLEDAALINPNGLYAEEDRLVVGAWGVMTDGFATAVPGHMLAVSLTDKSISSFGEGAPIGNLDGVELDHDSYLVTDWMAGKLYRINQQGEAELLLELEQGTADIEWITTSKMLLLPMMMNNKLLAYMIP